MTGIAGMSPPTTKEMPIWMPCTHGYKASRLASLLWSAGSFRLYQSYFLCHKLAGGLMGSPPLPPSYWEQSKPGTHTKALYVPALNFSQLSPSELWPALGSVSSSTGDISDISPISVNLSSPLLRKINTIFRSFVLGTSFTPLFAPK